MTTSNRLRPLRDLVIVQREEITKKTESGLFIIDTSTGMGDRGTIIAVGPGRRDERGDLVPMPVKPGQRVLFGRHAGQAIKVDGVEVLVLRTADIFAIIN